jgi:hypothetical protein
VKKVSEQTGAERIKAVIHCQGSTSFMMSAAAGLVPQVKTIVSNAVSLFTVIPEFASVKMRLSVPILNVLTPYLDPQWGIRAPNLVAKTVAGLVRLTHHECNNLVCKMVSFTYGAGFPALWSHGNLTEETHQWIRQEFAKVPISFFAQMIQCVRQGHLVAVDGFKELPSDFVQQAPQTDARFAFLAGLNNRCFLPQSQVQAFEFFDRHCGNYHSLHLLPNYGHLDVFFGSNAARDVFPIIYEELEKK